MEGGGFPDLSLPVYCPRYCSCTAVLCVNFRCVRETFFKPYVTSCMYTGNVYISPLLRHKSPYIYYSIFLYVLSIFAEKKHWKAKQDSNFRYVLSIIKKNLTYAPAAFCYGRSAVFSIADYLACSSSFSSLWVRQYEFILNNEIMTFVSIPYG